MREDIGWRPRPREPEAPVAPTAAPLLVDAAEAMRLLGGVSRRTLQLLMRDSDLPHHRLGKRLVRFAPAELAGWLAARRAATGEPGPRVVK